jgi:hypothetical protein
VGLFVTLQFSLAAIADIFGDVPEGILTPDHSFEGWFLVPFRVKLRIPSPQYRQEGAAPDEAGLSFAFTADVSVRRSDGTWTAPARFEGDALVDAPIERVAGTRSYRMGFADTQLQLAYATPPDAMADAFVQFAIHDYLRRRWRAFPLTPTLADERRSPSSSCGRATPSRSGSPRRSSIS